MNLTIYKKGAYYSGIKTVNNLPLEIKNVAVTKKVQNCFGTIFIRLLFLYFGRVP
jgi:hypothetical protein